MCNVKWSTVLDATDVNVELDKFYNLATKLIDQYAPYKMINFREKITEWVTNELLSLIDTREFQSRLFKLDPL